MSSHGNASHLSHPAECMCPPCLVADMAAHVLNTTGVVISQEIPADAAPERTRYARPGQAAGTGVVRKASPAQVRLILRLMSERDTSRLVRLPGSEDVTNMSLKGATDLIDKLFGCPQMPGVSAVRPASDKQITHIVREGARRALPEDRTDALAIEAIVSAAAAGNFISAEAASLALDYLFSAGFAKRTAAAAQISDGMYMVSGVVYKVQKSLSGGRLYAKRLTDSGFEYSPGTVSTLTPADRMTLEQAREYGALYGTCCACGRTLTDESSIEKGLGKICAAKFG